MAESDATRSEHHFDGVGGVRIVYDVWTPAVPARAVVVLSHGFGEHARRYDHVALRFGAAGLATFALDHRGHGRSGGRRVFLRELAEFTGDFGTLVAIAREQHPDLPVLLLGHSMGGGIVFAWASEHAGDYTAMVLSGPAVDSAAGVPRLKVALAERVGGLLPALGVEQLPVDKVSRDPAVVAAYQADPLVFHGKLPAGIARALLQVGKTLPERAVRLQSPLLVVHGGDDALVPVSGSRRLMDHVGGISAALKVYPGLYHEVFNEPERDDVLDDVVSWMSAEL